MARIVVTGGAGFIGSHVAEALLARGDQVLSIDNFDPYYDPARKHANIAEVQAHPNARALTFAEGSITDRGWLRRVFSDFKPEKVIHLAAMPGVRASIEDPHRYFEVNLSGTLNLLDLARDAHVKSFVFASTSSVYGNSVKLPFQESEPADQPLAPYAASKRSAEMLGYTYHQLYQLPFTALRFFTVYGPRNRPDMMAFKIVESILMGHKIPLYEGGKMYRDWTFVEDTAAGVLAAADRPLGYAVINLGRGKPVLLSDFLAGLEELIGRKAHVESQPKPASDAHATHADIGKARQLLGYAPKIDIAEGVEKLWMWYQRALLGKR